MPSDVGVSQVQQMLSDGAQLVDVLPEREYAELHLPGAINIPLKKMTGVTTGMMDRSLPVIVYCHDYQWDLSPRAAWRLESLGFTEVYDFAVGRAAWAASALPLEGALASLPTASDAARREVFTCSVSDPIEGMTDFMDSQGQDDCIALNEHGIVMGRTRRRVVEASSVGATVEEIMEIGPTTVRPDEPLAALVERMRRRGVQSIVVATLDGRLVGVLYRDEAESLLGIDASAIERE